MSSPSPRLTLLAVVRDEERLLPGLLDSVRGVVDELVVVDTGSTDGSVGLVRAAGARVVHHSWSEDFAAARNAGLAEVTDGWALVLDADERLAPDAGAALRAAIAAKDIDCGLLALHEADALDSVAADVVEGRARRGEPVLLPRLLRQSAELAYHGLVAEDLRDWLREGRRVTPVDAAIAHYGEVPELAVSRGRSELRVRLLERRCEAEPDDARIRALLAHELLRAGDEAGGREQAEHAWRLLATASPERRGVDDVVLTATVHAFQTLSAGDLDGAAEALAQAAEWGAAHPNLDLLAGALLESLALSDVPVGEQDEALATARAAYERCLAQAERLFTTRPLPGATSWAARTRLATVDLLCGRPDEALSGFEQALRERPSLTEGHLGRLEALLDLGLAPEVLQGLGPWLTGGTPDAWTLAASAAAVLGQAEDAALFAERARDAGATRPWAGPHRRLRLEALTAMSA